MSVLYSISMLSAVINWIFPASCLLCKDKGAYICKVCLFQCMPARKHEESWLISLFSYKDKAIKRSIWEIKYHGHFVAADAFGERLAEASLSLLGKNIEGFKNNYQNNVLHESNNFENFLEQNYSGKIIIAPIPPSKSGGKKRGYNQSEIIARALFENASFASCIEKNILEKIKQTERQATIHERARRLKNMEGAFAINDKYLAGKFKNYLNDKIIILVDDVTTTGATLHDARRALLSAGANTVLAITIAH